MSNSFFARLRQHLTIWVIGRKYRRLKSSMLQSLERNNPTEIDYLNGYIVQNKGYQIKGIIHNFARC
jgi:2-dehydropantoate 2-reductase